MVAPTRGRHPMPIRRKRALSDSEEDTPAPKSLTIRDVAGLAPELRPRDHEPPFLNVFSGQDANVEESIPTKTDVHIFERFKEALPQLRPGKLREKSQNLSSIASVYLGPEVIPTWYTAPYPEEYSKRPYICICSTCLKYMPTKYVAYRHKLKCASRTPPGQEIYRDGSISVFEVDGDYATLYCQNLCLLAKLFLDSKTLYYDVSPFMFYVLTKADNYGCHFLGYFSKLKHHSDYYNPGDEIPNNVSCIVTIPTVQGQGYGQFLISLSYYLTRLQGGVGTPERPLSALGLQTYSQFWKTRLCVEIQGLQEVKAKNVTVSELSRRTGMTFDDVVFTLEHLGWLNGTKLNVNSQELEHRANKWKHAKLPFKEDLLVWTPVFEPDYAL